MKRHRRGRAIKLVQDLLLAGVLVALLSSPLSDDRWTEVWRAPVSSAQTGDVSPRDERAAGPVPSDRPPSVDTSSAHVRIDAWGNVFRSRDLAGYDTARWVGGTPDALTWLPAPPLGGTSGPMPGEWDWSAVDWPPFDGGTRVGEGRGGGVPSGGSGSGVVAGVAGGRGGSAGSNGNAGASGSSPGSSPVGSGATIPIERAPSAPPAAAVPEPTTVVLLGSGLAGLSALALRHRRRTTPRARS